MNVPYVEWPHYTQDGVVLTVDPDVQAFTSEDMSMEHRISRGEAVAYQVARNREVGIALAFDDIQSDYPYR